MPFPIDINWVHATESKLGVKFPPAFVTAMVAMNGGSVRTSDDEFQLFPFFDGSDNKRIQRTCNSINRETVTARKDWSGFPGNAVAIGDNGAGDLLVFIPVPESPDRLQNSVYWWDHETGEIQRVSDDFSDLSKT